MDFKSYKLTSNPFIQQPSPTLFWSPSHREAWQNLVEGIERRQSFIFILGQSGLGATALYRAYIHQANPQQLTVLHDIDITVDLRDLLVTLLRSCGLNGATDNVRVLTEKLRQALHRAYLQGRQTVLLIDEAHALPTQALHNLSLLSDTMQHEAGHLLQIVLFGRPTLTQRQDLPQSQRFELGLARASELVPLTREQSLAYINHRLTQAATEPSTIFSRGALNLIATHARGVPKVIDIMCTDVLVAGLLQDEQPISARTVRSVIGDVVDVGLSPWLRWSLAGTGGLFLAMVIWQVLPTTRPDTAPETNVYQVAQASSPTPRASSLPASTQVRGTALQALSDTAATPLSSVPNEEGRDRSRSLAPADPTPDSSETGTAEPAPATPSTPATSPQQRETTHRPLATAELPRPTFSPIDDNAPLAKPRLEPIETTESTPMHDLSRTRMVCVIPRQGNTRGSDIAIVDRQADSVNRLIADGAQNLSPTLSPDGTLLAYTSYREGAPNIYLRDLRTGTEQQLTSGPWLALPGAWSPNGRYLALSQSLNGNYDIFIYDARRQRLQRLTKSAAVDVSPSFAPDSTRLVFASDRSGSPQLYLTDVTASPPKRLTQTGPYNTSPSWSPRDNTIAFIGRSANQSLDLYLIQADGTRLRQLTRGQRFHAPPAWAPDGQVLMGMSLRQAKWEQRIVSLMPEGLEEREARDLAQDLFRLDTPCLAPQWVAQGVP